MNRNERPTEQTGQFGARIVDALLKQQGRIPYRPIEGVAHPFDRLVATPDKRNLCIVEVKTKCCREAYEDTGIDQRHFDDYMHITAKYDIPMFLYFVDAKRGTVYGNWWHELIKSREPGRSAFGGCGSYPWTQKGIVYFPLDAMRVLYVLTPDERAELLTLRQSKWKPALEIVTVDDGWMLK